ncbi:ferritin-like domain-containing protein [Acrocarpospora sp. B8E8]|uniref:ferritin-like domain-containing protein n=1 Tax=Acrocarpospora sp. B8E8 TaxID=3153572 RepID=UPI00325CFCC7
MRDSDFAAWVGVFEAAADQRRRAADLDWDQPVRLDPAILKSVRRFQVGEDGDGANLISKAARAGNDAYTAAVRLFVAEERNHARMLAHLLNAAGVATLSGHWSDTAFVWLRRMLGLQVELMVLMIAEVIALRYYQALHEGTHDQLTVEVAALILADEQRHVPFHRHRLRQCFARLPGPIRTLTVAAWWCLMAGALTVVALDHGTALRRLGLTRTRFIRDVVHQFTKVATESDK